MAGNLRQQDIGLLEKLYRGDKISYKDNFDALTRLDRLNILKVRTGLIKGENSNHVRLYDAVENSEFEDNELAEAVREVRMTSTGLAIYNDEKRHEHSLTQDKALVAITFGYAAIILFSMMVEGITNVEGLFLGISQYTWTKMLIISAFVSFVAVGVFLTWTYKQLS